MTIWSTNIEKVLEGIRQNSIIMSEEHKKKYINLKKQLRYFKVPIIVLSAINSVVSIGLPPYIEQQNISVLTCLLALTCGIICSVELYFGINANMEKELTSSKDFYLLSVEIYKILTLDAEHRTIDGTTFLNEKYKEYTQLIIDSNIVVKKIADRLASLPKELLLKNDVLDISRHTEELSTEILTIKNNIDLDTSNKNILNNNYLENNLVLAIQNNNEENV